MDDLLDLIFDLIGWVLPLIGKFWFVILAYLGYKAFGKASKKVTQGKVSPTLTPVSDPSSFPMTPTFEEEERKPVRASAKYEPIEPESMEGVGVEQEWAFTEPARASTGPSLRLNSDSNQQVLAESKRTESSPLTVDPREGMKWALIFGEPRSKAPYVSPASRKRNA
ncbi:hypothetical protein [Brevibacillus reuszeri]|uniref:hypothetical protein n=1 Tax=Brevibacillus reuszeri TaxID=54915 RepID=UPI00289FB0CC|nr:hypothetical protein [Brevibacillus reuszeri]